MKQYLLITLTSLFSALSAQINPLKYASLAADKVMADADFQLHESPSKRPAFPWIANCLQFGNGVDATAHASISPNR